jgi:hypothetical protein
MKKAAEQRAPWSQLRGIQTQCAGLGVLHALPQPLMAACHSWQGPLTQERRVASASGYAPLARTLLPSAVSRPATRRCC